MIRQLGDCVTHTEPNCPPVYENPLLERAPSGDETSNALRSEYAFAEWFERGPRGDSQGPINDTIRPESLSTAKEGGCVWETDGFA